MSAARTSRRALLAVSAAALAVQHGISGAKADSPDPIFALLEAERCAWAEFDAACGADSDLEEAWCATEWHREPRALVGHYTRIVDDDYKPIPAEQWRSEPTYMTRRQVEDLHNEALRHIEGGELPEERVSKMRATQEAHRDDLLSRIALDAADIEAQRVAFGLLESDALVKRAGDAAADALRAVFAVQPTTAAGLLMMLDVCWERSEDQLCGPAHDAIKAAFAAVRGFIEGRV